MTETQTLNRLRRRQWHALHDLLRDAYRHGFEAGKARARGMGRRGRTIRADATVAGLVERIQRHFGLDRYGFEVRVVHGRSGRRVPTTAQLRTYRLPD
jgi:hypothetical protein